MVGNVLSLSMTQDVQTYMDPATCRQCGVLRVSVKDISIYHAVSCCIKATRYKCHSTIPYYIMLCYASMI